MSALTKAHHDVSNNGSVAELPSWEWTDEKEIRPKICCAARALRCDGLSLACAFLR